MAQSSFPPAGSPAVAQPRTLGEYRQEILAGLELLTNDDLGLLLTCYFPDLDHVQDATKNRTNILQAPLLVIEIWTRVNQFLASYRLPPLDGEAPPADLWNRSTRILITELPSAVSATSTPGAGGPWSCSEITLPGILAQPAPTGRGTTATIPVAFPVRESTDQVTPQPPGHRFFSWPAFGGLLLIVALIGVHVCPYVKHALPRSRPDHLLSLETPLLFAPAVPRFTVIPVDPLPPAPHTRSRHHRSAALAGRGFGLTSEPECQFTRARLVHGQLKDKLIKKKLPLPRGLRPGSSEAKEWLQAACERAKQEVPRRR